MDYVNHIDINEPRSCKAVDTGINPTGCYNSSKSVSTQFSDNFTSKMSGVHAGSPEKGKSNPYLSDKTLTII